MLRESEEGPEKGGVAEEERQGERERKRWREGSPRVVSREWSEKGATVRQGRISGQGSHLCLYTMS